MELYILMLYPYRNLAEQIFVTAFASYPTKEQLDKLINGEYDYRELVHKSSVFVEQEGEYSLYPIKEGEIY